MQQRALFERNGLLKECFGKKRMLEVHEKGPRCGLPCLRAAAVGGGKLGCDWGELGLTQKSKQYCLPSRGS